MQDEAFLDSLSRRPSCLSKHMSPIGPTYGSWMRSTGTEWLGYRSIGNIVDLLQPHQVDKWQVDIASCLVCHGGGYP